MRHRFRGEGSTSIRCARCRLHTDLCACSLIEPIPVRTRVILVAHYYEERKPTNTGHLALSCLEGAQLVRRGGPEHEAAHVDATWAADTHPVLLFPGPDAVPLDRWKSARPADAPPVTLIVPDGTWRQAKRVRYRVPGLDRIPCVSLPEGLYSSYRLRHAHVAGRLSTLEAVAHALGILEGPHVCSRLLHIFQVVVDRALWSNGRIATDQVSGGIPAGARQDGPDICRAHASSEAEPT
jgi:DTW domain-containing protein YfiP